MPDLGQRLRRRLPVGVECVEDGLDLFVALGDLGLVELIDIERLGQSEDMLFTVVSGERFTDRIFGSLAAGNPGIRPEPRGPDFPRQSPG